MKLNLVSVGPLILVIQLLSAFCGNALPVEQTEECSDQKIYIQWEFPASGWFHLNHLSGKYERALSTYPQKYEFFTIGNGEWILREWGKNWETFDVKRVYHPSDSVEGIGVTDGPLYTNVARLRGGAQTPTNRSGSTTSAAPEGNSTPEADVRGDQSTRAFRGEDIVTTKLKTFCPEQCKCQVASLGEVDWWHANFQHIDIVEEHIFNYCRRRLRDFSDIISRRSQNSSFGSKIEGYGHNQDKQEWKPTAYLRSNCDLLYFSETAQAWGIYMLEAEAFIAGFDSGPCLEYLPEGKAQNWRYFSLNGAHAVEKTTSQIQVVCISMETPANPVEREN